MKQFRCLSLFFFLHLLVSPSLGELMLDKPYRREPNFRYQILLDTAQTMRLFWDFDSVSQKVIFRLDADITRTDLLAFGFSGYGQATNADLVVLWTDLFGKHKFQDTHTDEEGSLDVDQHQDYYLDDVMETSRGISIAFHRLYDTCDDDDFIIDDGTIHMLFFTIPEPVPLIRGINITALQPRIQRVQLLKSQLPDPILPPDTRTFTMHVKNVPVPTDETTYWCSVHKLPPMSEKHHIVKYEKDISPRGKGFVHHLEVFHCEVPSGVKIPNYNAPCGSMSDRPKRLESCHKVIGAWAMGADMLTYPEEAGLPIGGPGYSRYVMLEVHYNNPDHIKDVVDSSGLKFYVTRTLRKYDAGIMELGQEYTDKVALPPGLPLWKLKGYCIPQCTMAGIPERGINIFASQLHTHLTGRRAYTKHYRNGIELPELSRDNHYSPHYQEIRKLHRQVHVLPGDALITTCEDQTIDNENVTLGGFSISDEMCVNYVHYYPSVELEVCKSSVTTHSLYRFFNFMKNYLGERTSDEMGISDNYKAIRWTPMNVQLLHTFYEFAPLSMQCNKSDGDRFPGVWENRKIPQVLYPLPPVERPCLQ